MYDIHLTTHNITQVEEALTEIIHKIPVLCFVINTSLTNTFTCPLIMLLKHFEIQFKHSLNVCCVHHPFHYAPITSSSAQLQDKIIVLKLFVPWLQLLNGIHMRVGDLSSHINISLYSLLRRLGNISMTS